MMSSIPLYLCEKNCLQREGVKSILANTPFKVVREFHCANDVLEANDEGVKLILLSIDKLVYGEYIHTETFPEKLNRMKDRFPDARLVLLMAEEDINSLSNILSLAVDGIILKNIPNDALVNYLNLTLMGEKVFPSPLVSYFAAHNQSHPHRETTSKVKQCLSPREEDILRRLVRGESNKLIAKYLDITEYTVKVHLKAILRKLGVHNRTQAALWAQENGFEELERSDTFSYRRHEVA